MKKNITINLFGSLYAIDEDAYTLLDSYLNSIKEHFGPGADNQEIVQDIESRIAELLQELKQQGHAAISIEHIQDIITRIGNPDDIDGGDVGTDSHGQGNDAAAGTGNRGKRMYRDENDKMAGGVASGMAQFLGIDPTYMRLIFVILFFVSMSTVSVVYTILWVILPPARTAEDRLRMRGEPVNIKNIGEEVMNTANHVKSYATSNSTKAMLHKLFTIFLMLCKAVVFLGVSMVMIMLMGLLLYMLIVAGVLLRLDMVEELGKVILPIYGGDYNLDSIIAAQDYTLHWVTIGIVSVTAILCLYLCINIIMRLTHKVKTMTDKTHIALYIGTVCMVMLSIFAIGNSTYTLSKRNNEARRQERISQEVNKLNKAGWNIIKYNNPNNTYTRNGEHYTGNDNWYIDSYNEKTFEYQIEQTQQVEPGTYRLEAAARSNGEGCLIYARTDKKQYTARVPNCDNVGGNIWEKARMAVEQGTANEDTMKMAAVNDNRGYGWNTICISNIQTDQSGIIHYGISNCMEKWTGTWFSACDFRLVKEK